MHNLAFDLKQVEDKAAAFYHAVSSSFRDKAEVSERLRRLAREEEDHSRIMNDLAAQTKDISDISVAVTFRPETQDILIKKMDTCIAKAEEGSLSLQELGEAIACIESSEWNSLFFCLVDAQKDMNHDCKMAAIRLQGHILDVQEFLELLSIDRSVIDRLKSLPPLWKENILIIEDEPSVSGLLKTILRNMGEVDVACDGEEGLEKIRQKYYALVICDIHMPKVGGIELYEQVQRLYPSIKRRFMFFAAGVSDNNLRRLKEYNVRLLEKPAPIKDIISQATDVLRCGTGTVN